MSRNNRVRYAPSPTGHLHIGGARTALFDYLQARAVGGSFIIRIEDTDQSRHLESGIENQLNGLKWLGIDWDESVDIGGPFGPYRQMERLDLYREYTAKLLSSGKAYYCYCSEDELDQERQAQEARGETPQYSGKCRHLTEGQRLEYTAAGRIPTVRFQMPADRIIAFTDRIRGEIEFDSNGIGDFIIVRPDGIPTYNFAVVIDDHLMEITLVIRGEEHLSNTPRQLMLYQAMNLPEPEFAHLSLILNQDRKKMSKRDESIMQFIEQYKENGYLPEAILNFIALLGWSPKGEEEIFSKEELIAQFSLDRVSKSPAVFDTEKLSWMNNQYIKKADLSNIVDLAVPHLVKAGQIHDPLDATTLEWVTALVGLFKDQLKYAGEIVKLSQLFFQEDVQFDEESRAVIDEEQVPNVLRAFLGQLLLTEEYSVDHIKGMIKAVQSETGCKGKQLFMPIRAALTGQTHGPDLNQTLFLLGKSKVILRLQKLLS